MGALVAVLLASVTMAPPGTVFGRGRISAGTEDNGSATGCPMDVAALMGTVPVKAIAQMAILHKCFLM